MYNKLVLIGRLGKDPVARGTNEKVVAAIDVATTNYYVKANGEGVEETEWTSAVAFGKLAQSMLKQCKKGDLVLVEGMKRTDSFEKEGLKRVTAYLQVDTFRRLSWDKWLEKEKKLFDGQPLGKQVATEYVKLLND